MKYIYLDREEAKKGIALVVAVLEEQNKNYKKDYGNNIVEFYGQDLPHYISYEETTDTVREATEEEKVARQQITLEDNQVIIDNIIYTYDKKFQKVENNKIVDKSLKELVNEKVLTLDEVKKQKLEEFKNIRDKKISENLEVDGAIFQVRPEDLQKFFLKKIEADLQPTNQKEKWRLADNSYKEIDFNDIKKILSEYGQRQRRIFKEFGVLEMKLKACKTVDEINALKWE